MRKAIGKTFFILTWLGIFCSIALLVLVTYWLTWPYKIAEQNGEARVLTPTIKNGETLVYELDYCKYMDLTPIGSRRQVVDGLIYPLPTTTARVLPKGCNTIIASAPIIVPECTECFDKDVHLEVTAIYQVNPLRKEEVTFRTQHFRLTK